MADEKKPATDSGGLFGGHDPLVLIIGGLLAITLLANLFGKEKYQPLATDTKKESVRKEELAPAVSGYDQGCGLSIVSPKPLQQVSGAILLEGIAGSCDWVPVGDIALYAQAIDSAGRLVSAYTPVHAEGGPGTPNAPILGTARPFRIQIPLTAAPSSKTGFLILVHPDPDKPTTKTVRIPIRF